MNPELRHVFRRIKGSQRQRKRKQMSVKVQRLWKRVLVSLASSEDV